MSDVNRIIKCFSVNKFQPLKKYAVKNIYAFDGCDELTVFLKKILNNYRSPKSGDRHVSESIIKMHLKEEVIKYNKIIQMLESDINYWIKQRDD